jgi:hypothetical protein
MIFALVIMTAVLLGALSFLQAQVRAFRVGNERMARLQNYRFAANVLEKDLRTIGTGVPGHQPSLVYAGEDVIAFNADYLTYTEEDPSAIYWDPDAPEEMTQALRRADQLVIPLSAFHYPETDYLVAGANSGAETIVFFFESDPEAGEEELFALYRQVNGLDPEIVARNLRRSGELPFFSYLHHLRSDDDDDNRLVEIPAASIPLAHEIPVHGSRADTAATGGPVLIDRIRAVRISYLSVGRDSESGGNTISRLIHLPDLGTATARTCGASPIMDVVPYAVTEEIEETDEDGNVSRWNLVVVSWGQSIDEVDGEKDVNRYVIWRRLVGEPDWGEPIESLRSGEEEYFIRDMKDLVPGTTYEYGVAAQDCTPNLSGIARSNAVTIPHP